MHLLAKMSSAQLAHVYTQEQDVPGSNPPPLVVLQYLSKKMHLFLKPHRLKGYFPLIIIKVIEEIVFVNLVVKIQKTKALLITI